MNYANDCSAINELCGVVDAITEERDNLQGQLAEAVSLLRKIEQRMYGEDVEHRFTDLLPDLDRIAKFAAEKGLQLTPMCDLPPEGWWCSREPGHEGPALHMPCEVQ